LTPERYLQKLDDAARRIAGCQFLDLGDSGAQRVIDEAMPDITAEQIDGLMRQVEQRSGKTREEMLALVEPREAPLRKRDSLLNESGCGVSVLSFDGRQRPHGS
jgi:hypothetical protein